MIRSSAFRLEVPFTFSRIVHALVNFSPAHVARRFVVYKLCAPWRQGNVLVGFCSEADTWNFAFCFLSSDLKASNLTCWVFLLLSFRTLAVIWSVFDLDRAVITASYIRTKCNGGRNLDAQFGTRSIAGGKLAWPISAEVKGRLTPRRSNGGLFVSNVVRLQ